MATKWILRTGNRTRGFGYTLSGAGGRMPAGTRERIDRLRIPPAWTGVHIALDSRAAIQAWGFDSRKRKQYRYHARAVQRGEIRKHYRVRQMARDLPVIRRKLLADSRLPGFPEKKVAAVAVRLIAQAFFRVGSERYVKENNTFGLTTLRKSHVTVFGESLIFEYTGKGSIRQRQMVADGSLARLITVLLSTPGTRLFRYKSEGVWRNLHARDVNDYMESLTDFPYTAKDLRTWGGTLRAATVLAELGPPKSAADAKRNVATTVRLVAAELGNTPAITRKSYVHPVLLSRYEKAGATIHMPVIRRRRSGILTHTPEEQALIRFLDEHFPERRKTRREA